MIKTKVRRIEKVSEEKWNQYSERDQYQNLA